MAVDNFIPELWDANIQTALSNAHVFAATANRSYEGMISSFGDTVKVNALNDPTVSSYTKNSTSITVEDLVATQRELKIDQSKYVAFGVDDVDKAQANADTLAETTRRAGYKFSDTADAYLAGLYAQAAYSLNTNASPVDLTSLNIEDEILALQEDMDVKKVSQEGRFIIVPPWIISKLILAGITTKTSNDALYANGIFTNIFGFDIIKSNNVSKNSSSWDKTRSIAGIRGQSYAYAEQILELEAYRPESSFEDAIKGLHLYGGKIIRPDMTWVWYADKTAEA